LIQINTASSNFHKLRWYRAVCRTDCSGYEARTLGHTGPRFYSGKRSGTLPNVLSTVMREPG
jgi:hypothetical protein